MDDQPSRCAERKEYCDKRLDDLRRYVCAQFTAIEKAAALAAGELEKDVTLARAEMERRLEGMNEFRAQLEKQASTFMSRDYYDSEHRSLFNEVRLLREWKSQTEGAKGWSNILAAAAVLISLAVGILHFFSTMRA